MSNEICDEHNETQARKTCVLSKKALEKQSGCSKLQDRMKMC